MRKFYEKYLSVKEELNQIECSNKERFLKGLSAFIITFIVLIGPLVFLINCLIYHDYLKLIYCGIALIIFLFILICRFIYYVGLNEKKNIELRCVYLFESLVALVLYVIIFIILMLKEA